jgi:hypothetical protein
VKAISLRHAGRDDLRQPLQHAEVGGHADVDLLHREEGVGAAHAQVAGGGQVERTADAAALDGGDDRKARLLDDVEAAHQLAQAVLEGQPRAAAAHVQHRHAAGEDVQRHAGAEMLAGRRDHQRPRAAFGVELQHGVAQRREERRVHRVQPLGAVELQVRHAVVGQLDGEEGLAHSGGSLGLHRAG